jgi:DNA-binding LacI/PurR family transcriptional regulator
VLQGVETGCAHRGWHVEFASWRYDAADDWSGAALPGSVEGASPEWAVILCGTNYANLPAALRERGIPFSLLGNGMAEPIGPGGADMVFSDDVQGACDATEHLIAQGHQDIVFVGDERSPSCRRRAGGYRLAMLDSGYEPLMSVVAASERESGYQAMKSMLSQGSRITAALAGNSRIAEGIFEAMEESPRGREIAVAGFGDERHGGEREAASVREFPDELGAVLADFAALRAERPAAAMQQFTVPTELVIADSLHSMTKGEAR